RTRSCGTRPATVCTPRRRCWSFCFARRAECCTIRVTMSPLLTVDKITCRYDRTLVFRELSLSVEEGSIACLLGPSGCGKTTALRAIAGFEPVQEGSISLDGQ